MDHTVEAINYCPENSTKIKLKFDHSTIQIARQIRSNHSPGTEETTTHKSQNLPKEQTPVVDSHIGNEHNLLEFDPFYINKVMNHNLDLIDINNRLSYKRLSEANAKPNSSGNQFITSHQLPLFLKTAEGNLYYDSNDKFEPLLTHLSGFLMMNIKNEHVIMGTDKGGIHSFAPRRRRRGTGKMIKK